MNLKKVLTVYKKELIETFRDKKTLILAILVPLLIYPLLGFGASELISIGIARVESQVSRVGSKTLLSDELLDLIKEDERLEFIEADNLFRKLEEGGIDAYLESSLEEGTEEVNIYYDGAIERSNSACSRLWLLLNDYKRLRQEDELTQRGLDTKVLDIVEVKGENIASSERMGGVFLGGIIPLLLIVMIAMGAIYPAIDLIAGEKERGTLETILTVPIKRSELIFGKYLTVTTVAILVGALNLLSMLLVYSLASFQLKEVMGGVDLVLSPGVGILLFLLLIPLVLFVSAIIMSVSLFAKNFKDAQNFLSPVLILLMAPAYIAMMPGVEMNFILSVIPIVNISLLFKEIFIQNFNIEYIFLVFVSNTLYSFLGIYLFARLFKTESILFAEGKGYKFSMNRKDLKGRKFLDIGESLLLTSGILFLFIYLGTLLQLRYELF
ncbi:ABC transporter permease subunit/CPBP intramembrane protease [Halonatronum saccharophilum]|uniref:ABC transporter permease subunit/CPBP intramembrane protease n=1 Tax=Halonatronum saccharophilum TaxID=150060 RepID=UPI0004868383|nr:ABC transporter permease subunit/CPBP intramembrane protease [Halonatronum saccharophilum]